jgi:hypothetical protein
MDALIFLKKKFGEGAILIGSPPILLEHWALPVEAPLWTVSGKIETNVLSMAHLFILYT